MVTLSVIKADIGGHVGHSASHPAIIEFAKKELRKSKLLIDSYVYACGDDLQLLMTHNKGEDNSKIHKLAWDVFIKGTKLANKLKLYAEGQDLLKDTFSGNIKGMGPGVAEMEFKERASEPILVFAADKTEPGAWNYPLYKIFADPFNTIGLVIDKSMHDGFLFEIHDVMKEKRVIFKSPEEIYDLLVYIGAPGRYVTKSVSRKDGLKTAVASTQRLALMAGRYVGKDDPVLIVRAQKGLPAVGEILEPFSFPYAVAGWMRGSHHGPLMPCAVEDATPTRFDGPPRATCLGFQINNGNFGKPRDMFADKSFDKARRMANHAADYFRRCGPFEPHRLDLEQMEYTTLPQVEKKLEKRWKKIK